MNLVTIEHLTKSYTERLNFIKNRGWFRGAGQGNRGARKKPGYALSAAEPEIYGG